MWFWLSGEVGMNMLNVAAVQMISGPDVDANLKRAEGFIKKAVSAGVELIVLPENFAFMGSRDDDRLAIKEEEGKGPIQQFVSQQAKDHGVYIVAGTVPLACEDDKKVYSSCLVYDRLGQQIARYNKIHLFDVIVSEEERYSESESVLSGDEVVTVPLDFTTIGLSVCYDLRFPELYRELLEKGAELLLIPSAFTNATGKVHWEVLLRARAIENLSYVIAPNQGGKHPSGRETYGHSMIIDPWGHVLASEDKGEGVITAQIDLKHLHHIRETFPATNHRRLK